MKKVFGKIFIKICGYCLMYFCGGFTASILIMGKITGLGSSIGGFLYYLPPIVIAAAILLKEIKREASSSHESPSQDADTNKE